MSLAVPPGLFKPPERVQAAAAPWYPPGSYRKRRLAEEPR